MTPNNNVNPLAWYDDIAKQDWRRPYASTETFCLVTSRYNLLPFQIIRRKRTNAIQSVMLYNKNDEPVQDITDAMLSVGLGTVEFNDIHELIVSPGIDAMPDDLPLGTYYAVLTDGIDTWYSELFTVVQHINKYVKIEYWGVNDLSYESGDKIINYSIPYRNILYVNSELAMPEYEFIETQTEDDGLNYKEKQLSKKLLKFVFVAPEFLLDALRIVWLADFIRISQGDQRYNVLDFDYTPKWESGGQYASVEVEATVDTLIKKLALSDISQYEYGFDLIGTVLSQTGRPVPYPRVQVSFDNKVLKTVIGDQQGRVFERLAISKAAFNGAKTFTLGDKATYALNLIRNSDIEKTSYPSAQSEYLSYVDFRPYFDEDPDGELFNLDDTYTISADVKTANVSGPINMYVLGPSGNAFNATQSKNVTQEYTRITMTGKFSEIANFMNLSFYGGYGSGITPVVRNVKIEKGEKATDWTPIPTDLTTGQNVELNISRDGFVQQDVFVFLPSYEEAVNFNARFEAIMVIGDSYIISPTRQVIFDNY